MGLATQTKLPYYLLVITLKLRNYPSGWTHWAAGIIPGILGYMVDFVNC